MLICIQELLISNMKWLAFSQRIQLEDKWLHEKETLETQEGMYVI